MQALLAVATVTLHPSLHVLVVLLGTIEHRANLCTFLVLILQPVLVLCLYYFLLDAIDNAQCDEQVVTL